MGRFDNFLDALAEVCNEYNAQKEQEKADKRKEFEEAPETKVYNRGTVIAAMAEQNWSSFDMDKVLEEVTNPEKAEAAVGLIQAGNYGWYDVCRVLKKL